MVRGKTVEKGATRIAQNGYHYTKCDKGWRLTHHLTAEGMLGRPLRENEMVRFKEPKYKRDPYDQNGIVIIEKGNRSLRTRKAALEYKIEELQAELRDINAQLEIEQAT